jgi:hypothetical protein
MNISDSAEARVRQRELVETAMHAVGGPPGLPRCNSARRNR